MMLHR